MRNIRLTIILSGILLLIVQSVDAAVKLPAIVSSNMVLQRNTEVVLWGWASAKEKITIKASWIREEINIKADKEGNWEIHVKTTNSKAPQQILILCDGPDILLENILFGEVWLCSGQSNMEQPVKGYEGQPTFGSSQAIIHSANPNLHLFTVEKHGSESPLNNIEKYRSWQEATPENVASFSAVAYFFGQQLQKILDVPVGLIHTSWGGSNVQAWMSKDLMNRFQEVDLSKVDITQGTQKIPTLLFNAMIHPLVPYTMKGVLWYQGESNRTEPEKYTQYFPAMVKDWRKLWGIGDFPFYFVQISPYSYGGKPDANEYPNNSAFIREAQLQCLDMIPNSGMAVTMDIGDKYCIHPPKKKEVADRLLYNALQNTYGYHTVDGLSPAYESMEVKGNMIELKFKNAENGLYAYDGLNGFEIAGEDRVFYPAEAKIDKRKTVIVSSKDVPEPVAVRYAWRNWVEGTLFDASLLPASSFRTDDW